MFRIEADKKNVLHLHGRLDATQVETANEVLDRIETSCTLDLTDLNYISSAGLGALLNVQKRINPGGHQLKLIHLTPHIRDIFVYAGFDLIFDIQ